MAVLEPISKYKVVFLGDESVGKTSVITSFMYNKFDTTYKPTLAIDFMSTTMYHDDKTLRLQLWDTGGATRFRSLIPNYVKDASATVIVYDVTNRDSFLSIATWIKEVRKERGTGVIIILVANKCDLLDKRQVAIEEGDDKARELGFMFIGTSAKEGLNTKPLFQKLAIALSEMEPYSPTKQEDKVDVNLQFSDDGFGHTRNTQELTHDEHTIKYQVNEEKGYTDTKDNRGWSILERMMKDMLKKIEEMEEKVKECRNVYDERYENMLKRMEEMQDDNKRLEDNVKECRKDMLKWMEEVKINRIDVVEERGVLQDMSKRLAEMQGLIFWRLGELQSQKEK